MAVTIEQTRIEQAIAESMVEDPPLTAQPDDTIDPRVLKGAAWLDETIPDWADMINLRTFKISSSICCVLGQIGKKQGTGPYEAMADRMFGAGSCYGSRPTELGFYVAPSYGVDTPWKPLQQGWEKVIKERQGRA